MDYHVLFDCLVGLLSLITGGFAFVLWQNLRDVREEAQKASGALRDHELYCAREYVTNDGLTKSISDLKETITGLVAEIKRSNEEARQNFRDVFSKLNDKQDKH